MELLQCTYTRERLPRFREAVTTAAVYVHPVELLLLWKSCDNRGTTAVYVHPKLLLLWKSRADRGITAVWNRHLVATPAYCVRIVYVFPELHRSILLLLLLVLLLFSKKPAARLQLGDSCAAAASLASSNAAAVHALAFAAAALSS